MSQTIISPSPYLLTLGGTGLIFQLNEFVVVKIPRDPGEPDHATEQRVSDVLEVHHPPHPNLLQSLLRVPGATFLERLPGGDLASLLRDQQTKDPKTQQVLAVAKVPSTDLTFHWMKELASAAAWLEGIGLAHCDIRPPNILLDADNHAVLCDFDRTIAIGERLEAGMEPFARLLGSEGGGDVGTYGKAGARTEQFAFGSIFYSLTRGYDPYENHWFGADHDITIMDMLQKREFPPLTLSCADTIIRQCWDADFATIKEIESSLLETACRGHRETKAIAWYVTRQEECKEMVRKGSLVRECHSVYIFLLPEKSLQHY